MVLDTNIYIPAATSAGGPNAMLLKAAMRGRYVLLVSRPIITEVAKGLRLKFKVSEPLIQKLLREIARNSEIVPEGVTIDLLRRDPSDNRILECAINGRADLIVSNDHHLLDLKTCEGIPIVAGLDFRRTLGLR